MAGRIMESDSLATYPPLNTLKRVAEDIWIVDGPVIRFGPPLLKMPFSTRMTIIRIGGDLLIHSPTPLTAELKTEVEGIGRRAGSSGRTESTTGGFRIGMRLFPTPRFISRRASGEQAGTRIDFDCQTLDRDRGYPWDAEVATLPVEGSYMTEVVFFHRASRTLVLTDLIENFEPRKLNSFLMRVLTWLGGVQDPDGAMPRDMRMSYRDKRRLRGAVETMIGWNPERIILAHGRWYDRNGAAELRRAFRWLLG